jgi:hypothetical protein
MMVLLVAGLEEAAGFDDLASFAGFAGLAGFANLAGLADLASFAGFAAAAGFFAGLDGAVLDFSFGLLMLLPPGEMWSAGRKIRSRRRMRAI